MGSEHRRDRRVRFQASGLSPTAGSQRRPLQLRVVVTDRRGQRVPSGGLAEWLVRVAPTRARGVVGVALVSDWQVRSLNCRYRGRNDATDVLSFPGERPRRGGGRSPIQYPYQYLGDIVIARGVARRQARFFGHDERQELRVLALHGLLHLLGYDHECDDGKMARVERALRIKGGLADSLTERAPRGSAR